MVKKFGRLVPKIHRFGGESFGRLSIYTEGNQGKTEKVGGLSFGELIINHQIHQSFLPPIFFYFMVVSQYKNLGKTLV